ncbi:MAG: hypothetical protein CFH06_00760 [Alphaproteobacteria bacterium MarineAlpha3_Bin5]|nr:hypothetical protein [Magnetovibrio sp.]PPR78537.1 MAG: hypothetical protein CFH06_00760 [Alphaproteobacteria bacterium MarineAlpha3_Bin5]
MTETLSDLLAKASDLATSGLYSASSATLGKAISLAPNRQDLIVKRAWLDHQIGNDVAARLKLGNIKFDGKPAMEAAILHMEIDAGANIDANKNPVSMEKANQALKLVLRHLPWGELHERFVSACRELNLFNFLLAFLRDWVQLHGTSKKVLVRASEVLLELEEPISAYKMLNYIWEQQEVRSEMELLLGRRKKIREDNPSQDFKLLDKIDRAFDLEDKKLARVKLPDGQINPSEVKVLYVGSSIVGAGLERSNDIAAHYIATSKLAGGNCDVWLDTNLVVPQWNRASDRQVVEAIDEFRKKLADERPDLLVLDTCTLPTGRGLTPKLLKQLKKKYKFRVAGLLRDPLKVAHKNIEAWAIVSDTLICGDPTAFFVRERINHLQKKALFMPIPAFHDPFCSSPFTPNRDLLFIGSTFGIHRSMLISMLGASSDISIDLVIGRNRRKLAPDEASYATLISNSRGVLNISAHHPSVNGHLVTGRVWEAIACRSLLVEQRNLGTESFFVPWRHFLPWVNPADLIHGWRIINRHENYRLRIANAAYEWALRHYNPSSFWRALVNHGFCRKAS